MTDLAARGARLLDFAAGSHARAVGVLLAAALLLFLPGFASMPPMDRDEPRFAQASKQMLESGDFVDIRFQGEARHKKPVGIYWLQASVVAMGEAAGVPDARRAIWLYRLPSLAGAILAVLATYWAALAFVSRRNALVAALLFAATILIGVEARLAKTDAVVTATVVIGMGVLARAWLALPLGVAQRALFWIAMAAGILVKGPITPMIPAFAALALGLWRRRAGWLRALSPLAGAALCLLLIAPWFVLIAVKTGGAFFDDSLGADMLAKVGAGKEAHGAPPGLYLLLFWATAWPLAPFAALAAPFAWARRRDPAVAFLLAWIVPAWLLFEAVPTKLPHYVLPLYPAIAILAALAIERGAMATQAAWARVILFLLPIVGAAIALAGAGLWFWEGTALAAIAVAALAGLVWRFGLGARAGVLEGQAQGAAVVATVFAALTALIAYEGVIGTRAFAPFALSPRVAAAWREAEAASKDCGALALASAGFHEPSLVFLTRTDLALTDGAGAASFMQAGPCRAAIVESREAAAFAKGFADAHLTVSVATVTGVNINGGKAVSIEVRVPNPKTEQGPATTFKGVTEKPE